MLVRDSGVSQRLPHSCFAQAGLPGDGVQPHINETGDAHRDELVHQIVDGPALVADSEEPGFPMRTVGAHAPPSHVGRSQHSRRPVASVRFMPGREYAAAVGALVDRVFVTGMRAAREAGGREVVARHGSGAGLVLIEFRTALANPGRAVTPEQFAGVLRYRDLTEGRALLESQADAGWLDLDDDGAFRATEKGRAFLRDVLAQQGEALSRRWSADLVGRLLPPVGHVLDTVEPGPALRSMLPVYEPTDAESAVLLLNRLGTLRYHRSDAHAVAWEEAGHTAASIQALPDGPERTAIENRTNDLVAPAYGVLSVEQRDDLLADLAKLEP